MSKETNGSVEPLATETPAESTPVAGDEAGKGALTALEHERDRRRKAIADAEAARAERDALLAEKQALMDAEKSEIQKATERAEKLEKELAAKSAESARLAVIAKHSIPEEYQDLVFGEGDELDARAEKVKSLIKTESPTAPAASVPGIANTPAPPAAATLDERIAAAEQANDRALVMQLKAQKLGS